MKECPMCESECVERHVFEDIQWGTDGHTKYGRHLFKGIEQRYFECLKCGETFYDMEQAHFREANLNEAIKAKLGFDWLAESEARRKANRANSSVQAANDLNKDIESDLKAMSEIPRPLNWLPGDEAARAVRKEENLLRLRLDGKIP